MKHNKLLIGFGLALAVFVGVFYSHQSRYNLFSSLVNPVDFSEFSGVVSLTEEESEKVLKYKNGEFLIVYPGSEMEITKEKKELKQGAAFFSAALTSVEILEQYLPSDIYLRDKLLVSGITGNAFSRGGIAAFTVGSPEWIEQMLAAESGEGISGLGLLNNFNEESSEPRLSKAVKRDYDYAPARVNVGNIEVHYPYSGVYIDRPEGGNRTIIYALGGGVKIYFPGSFEPFFIPSHHRVTILDIMISERTAQLYYTKLQKDFRLEPFDIILPTLQGNIVEQESPKDRMAAAWKLQEQWRADMSEYAFSAHSTLISSTRQTPIQPAIDLVSDAQKKYAIGYPEERKDKEFYQETLEPFVKFINKLNYEGDIAIPSSLLSFYSTIKSEKWIRLMQEQQELKEAWNAFYVSHQAAIRKIDSNDKYYVFFDYWNNLSQINTFDKIQKLFLEGQLLDLMGKKYEAKVHYDRIAETLKTKSIPSSAKEDTTNLRRGFGKVLRSSSFYQTIDLFGVFKVLTQAEFDFYKNNNEIHQEIRLEVARDALSFLNNFVEKGINVEESNLLLEVYKSMGIKEIQVRLNRDIFSEKEMEMITFIDLLGTSRITREEIDRIKVTLAIQEELRQIDEELGLIEEEKPVAVRDPNLIETSDHLRSFFSGQELDTYRIIITKTGEELSFRNLFYKKHTLTGTFNINRQAFVRIRTNILSQENIRRNLFSSYLKEIDFLEERAARESDRVTNTNPSNTNNISQNDRIALSYRQRVLNLVRRYDIKLNLSDVLVLDKELSQFSIKNATLKLGDKGEQKLSFTFNLPTESLTDLALGDSNQNPSKETIKINDLKSFIQNKEP